jgi:hypothetical protein
MPDRDSAPTLALGLRAFVLPGRRLYKNQLLMLAGAG